MRSRAQPAAATSRRRHSHDSDTCRPTCHPLDLYTRWPTRHPLPGPTALSTSRNQSRGHPSTKPDSAAVIPAPVTASDPTRISSPHATCAPPYATNRVRARKHLTGTTRPIDRGATTPDRDGTGRTTLGPGRERAYDKALVPPGTHGTHLALPHGPAGGAGSPQPPRCPPSGDANGVRLPWAAILYHTHQWQRTQVRVAAPACRGGF